LYELTNALTDRNWDQSLFFLDSLLGGEIHALQVLAAIANQVRKLLLAKDFAESTFGAAWHPAGTYPQFQKSGMPAVVQFDRERLARSKAGKAFLAETLPEGQKGKRPKCPPICSSLETGQSLPGLPGAKKSEPLSPARPAAGAGGPQRSRHPAQVLDPPSALILERVVWQICSPAS